MVFKEKQKKSDWLHRKTQRTVNFLRDAQLSELARHTPNYLVKHFDSQHNWLLSEFIQTSPLQFIDEISSEITGQEFMVPGRANR